MGNWGKHPIDRGPRNPIITGWGPPCTVVDLLINGIYWGYNPLANHLLSSWDIQANIPFETKNCGALKCTKKAVESKATKTNLS